MKKKIIITISFSFSIRYIIRTGLLDAIKEFAEPVIVLTWKQEDLIEELSANGYKVYLLPATVMTSRYAGIRKKTDIWFKHFRLKSPSKKIQEKYLGQYLPTKTKLIRNARAAYNIFKNKLPGYTTKLLADEKIELYRSTNYHEILAFTKLLKAHAVFTVTPFHHQEDIFLRTCKNEGLQMFTAIHSFDNITKRGWIPVGYDAYMVWNKYNKAELNRIYPETINKLIYITGAPQFDFYFNQKNLFPPDEWKKLVGLPEKNRKIILYAGGPKSLFPNEPQYLKHLVEAVEKGIIRGNPVILFRCHPIDNIKRWKEAIGNSPHVFYETSWSGKQKLQDSNITMADIKKLCSALAYTDVHINLCSTMTVDGSAYNKPQIGPAYDEKNPANQHLLQQMYMQEHFKPVINTRALVLAKSKQQLINLVNNALDNPAEFLSYNKLVTKEIITYTDGCNMQRVAAALKSLLN